MSEPLDGSTEIIHVTECLLPADINRVLAWATVRRVTGKRLESPDLGPQRSPAGVAQVHAQWRQVEREMG